MAILKYQTHKTRLKTGIRKVIRIKLKIEVQDLRQFENLGQELVTPRDTTLAKERN